MPEANRPGKSDERLGTKRATGSTLVPYTMPLLPALGGSASDLPLQEDMPSPCSFSVDEWIIRMGPLPPHFPGIRPIKMCALGLRIIGHLPGCS
jgi:hypothetical protein